MRKISYDITRMNNEGEGSTNIMKARWASVDYYTITLPATRKVFKNRKTAISFLRALAIEATDLYVELIGLMSDWDKLQSQIVLNVGAGRFEQRMMSNRGKRFMLVSKTHQSFRTTRESRGYSMSAVYEDFMMMYNINREMMDEAEYLLGNMKRSEYWNLTMETKAIVRRMVGMNKLVSEAQIEGYDYVVVSICGGSEMVEPVDELLTA